MSLALLVYAIYTLSSIKTFLVITSVVSTLLLIACGIAKASREDYPWYFDTNAQGKKVLKDDIVRFRKLVDGTLKYAFITLITTSSLQVIIPSEKTAWLMVGAYAGQKVAENEKVQHLSGKVLLVIENKIDDYLNESTNKGTPK